jgi:hypothetical protein
MKTYKKVLNLLDKGISLNTVSRLSESQINLLHNKLMLSEQSGTVTMKQDKVDPTKLRDMTSRGINVNLESEMFEDDMDDVTSSNALGKVATQSYTGQDEPHDANDMGADGMDDDSDNNRKDMGEEKESNPWAICTSQLGSKFGTKERRMWSPKQKNEYERCVKDVKKSLKEGKNPVSLFLENKITRIVEKNLPPKISKKDLVKFLQEQKTKPSRESSPVITPDKPKTRPTKNPVKHPGKKPFEGPNPDPKAKKKEVGEQLGSPSREREGSPVITPARPKTRPTQNPVKHPGKKPFEGPNPDPKAKSKSIDSESAKDAVINAILNIIKK